jgi:hypothetical protein
LQLLQFTDEMPADDESAVRGRESGGIQKNFRNL